VRKVLRAERRGLRGPHGRHRRSVRAWLGHREPPQRGGPPRDVPSHGEIVRGKTLLRRRRGLRFRGSSNSLCPAGRRCPPELRAARSRSPTPGSSGGRTCRYVTRAVTLAPPAAGMHPLAQRRNPIVTRPERKVVPPCPSHPSRFFETPGKKPPGTTRIFASGGRVPYGLPRSWLARCSPRRSHSQRRTGP
jgi:hypothetical protein